ncbi:MAG: cytochrome c [Sphingomonas sp.]|nr:cytochrome c [Sphingomonas sp.]
MMGITVLALAGVAACNGAQSPVASNETDAVEGDDSVAGTIRTRQAHYKEMARLSKAIGDQLKARNPAVGEIQGNARRLADLAPQILTWFPAGSGPESGIRTRARPEIWTDQEGFGEAAARFVATSQEFSTIAGGGDLDAIRTLQPDLGPACRNCHDRFRAPEQE